MRSVGLRTLENKLSEYVRLAASGETVLISDRDRVVAELVPPRETRSEELPDAILADAARKGLLTPAALPPGPPPVTVPVTTLRKLIAELSGERDER
jgi:antitoxin (DNA-binding transcriptional repressor) of toxin-antitoxin stability system